MLASLKSERLPKMRGSRERASGTSSPRRSILRERRARSVSRPRQEENNNSNNNNQRSSSLFRRRPRMERLKDGQQQTTRLQRSIGGGGGGSSSLDSSGESSLELQGSRSPTRSRSGSRSPTRWHQSSSDGKRRSRASSSVQALQIMLHDQEIAVLTTIRLKDYCSKARKWLQPLSPLLESGDFRFVRYKQDNEEPVVVDRKVEGSMRISMCTTTTTNHGLVLRLVAEQQQQSLDLHFGEEELRELTPEAESVVRSCFRFLDGDIKKQKQDLYLPSLFYHCVSFIQNLARATVESRHAPTNQIHWVRVEQRLHELERLVKHRLMREPLYRWWFYRKDQRDLVALIASVQKEFRACVRDDHPVFFVAFSRSQHASAEALVELLHKVTPEEFVGSTKHAPSRRKLAAFLDRTEADMVDEINSRKGRMMLHAAASSLSLFGQPPPVVADKVMSRSTLKEILAPLIVHQEAFVDDQAGAFLEHTREWAFREFDDWTRNAESPHRCFLFSGSAGTGKTAFASKIVRTRRRTVLAYHFCRHDDSRFRDPKVMLLNLTYQICLRMPAYERRIQGILSDHGLTRKQLLNACSLGMIFSEFFEVPFHEIGSNFHHKFVVVIDGLNEARQGESGKNEIIDAIREFFLRLPHWICPMFTTRPTLAVLKKLRLFNALLIEPDREKKKDSEDMRRYFLHALDETNYGDPSYRPDLAQTLVDHARGSFVFATIIRRRLEEAARLGHTRRVDACIMSDLPDLMKNEYQVAASINKKLFWDVTKLCMVALTPMNKKVYADLTLCSDNQLRSLLIATSTFFLVSNDDQVHFRHKFTKDWLLQMMMALDAENKSVYALSQSKHSKRTSFGGTSQREIVPKQAKQSKPGDEIGKCYGYFAERVRSLLRGGIANLENVSPLTREYLLKFGVHHLALAKMDKEAREIILDPNWLTARANDTEGIAECCELLSDGDQVLHLLGRAVHLAMEATNEDSRQLTGQLVGRLMAATTEGHGDPSVRHRLRRFIHDLKNHDYGFQWWCPVAPTWGQAEQVYMRTLVGHEAPVQTVAWHCAGRRCASGSWDCGIRIWDTLTGHCEVVLNGHGDTVWAIDWENNGSRLVSCSLDRTVRLWDTTSEKCQSVLRGHTDSVWAVRFSKDDKLIASGSRDKTIRLWDSQTSECLRILDGGTGGIYCVAWEGGTDGRLCSGGTDNAVRVWNIATGDCEMTLDRHKDWIRSVDWTGKQILSGSADRTVLIWDAVTGACEQVLMGHGDTVWSVGKSNDGRYAASGSTDGTVRVWDCTSGVCSQVLEGHSGPVWSVSWCCDGKRLLSGSSDKGIILWDSSVGREEKALSGHSKPIWSLDVTRDGSTILSGSADKTARLWNVSSGQCERVFEGHTGPVWTVKLSFDQRMLATGSTDSTAAVYRITNGERLLLLVGHSGTIWSVRWTMDDRTVVTASQDLTVRLWSVVTGKCTAVLEGHTKDVRSIAVGLDGRRLASASTDETIRVWDLEARACEQVMPRTGSGALCIQWNKDNVRLVAGYTSGAICIWNVDSGEREVEFLPGHSKRVNCVDWSPDGQKVVSASTDKEIRVWSIHRGCERRIRTSSAMGIFGVRWTGRYLVSCGADKKISVFDAETGHCESVLSADQRNSLGVYEVAWSGDGSRVVSGSRDRTVRIWNTDTGTNERTLLGHTNWVHTVDFEKGRNQRVVSRSDDGSTRVWNADSGACECILEEGRLPKGFIMEHVKKETKDLRPFAKPGQPVGIQCSKVRVYNDRACGFFRNEVKFFKLIGKDAS